MAWTRAELAARAVEGEDGLELTLELAELGTVTLHFYEVEELDAQHVTAVHEFVQAWTEPETRAAARELLWAHCLRCVEEADYGAEPGPGETHAVATLRHLGIEGKDSVLSHLEHLAPRVQTSTEDQPLQHRYVVLEAYPPWEPEHGSHVVFQDGLPVT